MNTKSIIEITQTMEGNYYRRQNDIYIAPLNMKKFVKSIENCDELQTILITPYLINIEDDLLYELHYYEFELEVLKNSKSHFIKQAQNNILPKEISENLNPKAIVAEDDKKFFITAVQSYLDKMAKMSFSHDKHSNIKLEKADLYYQIY